ncbi:hypothetical protein CO174_03330 [Candidatus Uhrbacteria bacterium CG_4_9_14_3_um_filter_50_9]|uniref:Uncharacterized protein n=1 Tax=Candidatus Uhrbacteria bacterium CG_4_9_14_3_um_filter_50_9 TaxID=1975035 RepID=A0A2M7XBX6_9BACT|nr:MAG: hypothetical protein CO174_03330 [Candidatus Uhrbacteria bacterium CG_4_9_14_3_um_filter_50_9]
MYKEERVRLPDPLEPVYVTRDLTLARDGEDPLEIREIRLIILVNRCLYLTTEDGHGLKTGQVLWRNLALTERRGGSRSEPASEQFIAYDSLNHARRVASLLEPSYREVEDPDLRKWLKELDWMVRTSWTLHEVSEDDQRAYEWRAASVADDHARVQNRNKVAAVGRTAQAASIKDTLGRPNPGRLPLVCFAGERALRKRVNEIRGIGRRISWRQLVLEHYIDRLREIVLDLSRSAEHRLRCRVLFGEDRTVSKVRLVAASMEGSARTLRTLVGRPFNHTFQHVATDLDTCVDVMRRAAEHAKAGRIDEGTALMAGVKSLLQKIYRSVQILQFHWQLEEILVQTSRIKRTSSDLSPSQQRVWHDELRGVQRRLYQTDPVTGQAWDDGFRRKLVHGVASQIHLADTCLMQPLSAGGPNIKQMHEHLKSACKRF